MARGLQAVSVSFSHGYSDVPASIAAATRSLRRRITANPDAAISVTRKMGTSVVTKAYATQRETLLAECFTGLEKMVFDRFRVAVGS